MILKNGYDHMIDWWMLGCLTFELFYKYPCFNDKESSALYEKIVNCNYKFPKTKEASDSLKDFIKCLLIKDPSHRLGNVNGYIDLFNHDYLKVIKINKILNNEYKPPFIPRVSNETDLR